MITADYQMDALGGVFHIEMRNPHALRKAVRRIRRRAS